MIINSLLDTDLYKLTMQQAVFYLYPNAEVEYKFKCRNNNVVFTKEMVQTIIEEVNHFCTLTFIKDEIQYLSKFSYFKKEYLEYLSKFKLNRNEIEILLIGTELNIRIKGNWLTTILYEVPILAIVNEVYFNTTYGKLNYTDGDKLLRDKIEIARQVGFPFMEFGTRRRRSFSWQKYVLNSLVSEHNKINFLGTSNVYFSYLFGIEPKGTMAHEWLMAHQVLRKSKLIDFQKDALDDWIQVYRGDLGIALTDTVGIDAFLKDFDGYYSRVYDGIRQDSGSPYDFTDKAIRHYQSLDINPKHKKIMYSNNLNFKEAGTIYNFYKDITNPSFGIGTNLTNDFTDAPPLNIVIKMISCNGRPVAKLSDDKGKNMCENDEYSEYLKSLFEEEHE